MKPNAAGDACVTCTGTFCSRCNSANVCEVSNCPSAGQLTNVDGTQCFSCQVLDCLNCNSNDVCARCSAGLVPSANGDACVSCPADCASCDANGMCLQCTDSTKKPGADGRTCITCTGQFCSSCLTAN